MNQPWIYMYSLSRSPLPPLSPPYSSGSSQCTRLSLVERKCSDWYWPGFLAFPTINRNWLEFRQEIQARLYLGPCCSTEEQEQTVGSLGCFFPEVGWTGSLNDVRVEVCGGAGLEGWLRRFAHPLSCIEYRGCVQYPAFALNTTFFALGSSEVAVGFFSLL